MRQCPARRGVTLGRLLEQQPIGEAHIMPPPMEFPYAFVFETIREGDPREVCDYPRVSIVAGATAGADLQRDAGGGS